MFLFLADLKKADLVALVAQFQNVIDMQKNRKKPLYIQVYLII